MLIRLSRDHAIWTGRVLKRGNVVDMPDEDAYLAFATGDPPGLPFARVRWVGRVDSVVEACELADVRGEEDGRFLYRARVAALRAYDVGASRLDGGVLIGQVRPKAVFEVRSDLAVELVAAGVCRYVDPVAERIEPAPPPYRIPARPAR
ncbi:DUF2612 domain-containing protein [Paludisphaera rhizosphaerae]|uniref:DUF2612 domain-containing protein n=1 Tax=Paludisphaera rhizosphaerae TaxID=2711216 RepID=UPI0013ED5930|nr:DUF2612 domain-containing protein [Paludisphaera rhizosphaerae]